MSRVFALAFALVLMGGAVPAQAQFLPRAGGPGGLDASDYDLIERTMRSVAADERAGVGTTGGWQNDKTGRSGTVRLGGAKTIKGLACRTVVYTVTAKAGATARTYRLDWCKTPEGEWKIG